MILAGLTILGIQFTTMEERHSDDSCPSTGTMGLCMMQSRVTLESKVGLKEGTERTPGQEESKVEDMDSHEHSGKGELSKQTSEAKLALVACVVLQARLVLPAPSGFVARLVLAAPSVPWARTVSRVTPVPRVSRVIPVRLDPRARLAQLVSLVRMARMAKLDPRVCVEIVARKVCVASLAPLAPKASRARRALRVAPAPAGSKGFKAPRVMPVRVAPSVLVVVVPPVPRDLKVSKGPRESVASPVRVRVALLAPWAPRVSVARWASKVPREIQGHQGHRGLVDAMV